MTNRIWELADFRCSGCNRLLMKQAIALGRVELKCPKCGRYITFSSGYQEDKETGKTAEIKQGVYYAKIDEEREINFIDKDFSLLSRKKQK